MGRVGAPYLPIRPAGHKPAPVPYFHELMKAQNMLPVGITALAASAGDDDKKKKPAGVAVSTPAVPPPDEDPTEKFKDIKTLTERVISQEVEKLPGGKEILSFNEWKKAIGLGPEEPDDKWVQEQRKLGYTHTSAFISGKPVNLPVEWLLKNSRGSMGERDWISRSDLRSQKIIDKLSEDMKTEGFHPRFSIHTMVDHKGKILITEGNHRLLAAEKAGLDFIPSTITWEAGSDKKEYVPDSKLTIQDVYEINKNLPMILDFKNKGGLVGINQLTRPLRNFSS